MRETNARNLLMDWDLSDLPLLKGFGNSLVKPLGRKAVTLEIDNVRGEVKILIVPDQYLLAPILVGQTFTEQPHVMAFKTNDELIFLQKPEIVGENEKLQLFIQDNIAILPRSTSPMDVKVEGDYSGGLFVQYGHRQKVGNTDYMVLPGIYKFENGKGYVMISNLSNKTLNFKVDELLTRGYRYKEVSNEYVGTCTTSQTGDYQPLPIDQVKLGIELTETDKRAFYNLLDRYRDCFALNLKELGRTDLSKMHITLNDNVPVVHNPYRMSQLEREQLSKIIEDLLSNDIIRESTSSYSSPVILVKKKNGEKRLCIDYRALNRKTLKDKYPLPRIEDQLDSFGGNAYFCSLDLASGYYQVPMDEENGVMNTVVSEFEQPQDIDKIREEVAQNIEESQKQQKEHFDKSRKKPEIYKVGDLVRVQREARGEPGQSKKLVQKCAGPYRISKVLGNDRYEVEDTPITRKQGAKAYKGTYAVDKLHPCCDNNLGNKRLV
ncbi:uncharacterized protein LOC134654795 [Cydia amplana]|uniref:uncharacterized protein LOC134654795 n=1 Tax=Cydia amplana TaxID=1869771 RepID=UPI002FE5BC8B